jgi:hypothetical protein
MTASENECREEFEVTFKDSLPLRRGLGRQYLHDEAQFAWEGWKASWNARSQDAKDAMRYRWIRNDQTGSVEEAILIDRYGDVEVKYGEALDQAIDAAMSKGGREV